jgi:alpha-mannosidase
MKTGWREAGVVAEAARFNSPVLFAPEKSGPRSFAATDDPNLVIDTIKRAEDGDGIILRMYECHGARGVARLTLDRDIESAAFTNILEEETGKARVKGGAIEINYTPYQIVTVRVR